MSYIKTWNERCDEHPDHQSGMVSNGMIQARMQEEIDDLRADNERLRADLATQQGCCDGAAAQDAHIRQEREEHRVEVEKQRAEIERLGASILSLAKSLRAALDAAIRQRDEARTEIERLREEDTKTRHALKGWVFVCPDGGDEPTHERVSAVVAEIEKLRAENERLHADRRERIATAALQGMLASAELVAPPVHAGFIAKWAVVYADALIAKLDEEPQP